VGYTPYDFQTSTIKFGIKYNNVGYLLSLGLGKTLCAINTARYRIQNNNVDKVLVICPTSILWKWENDIHTQSEYKAIVLHGTERERTLLFKEKSEFYIINYEALNKFLPYLNKKQFKMTIADESARYIQTHNSQRTEASIDIGLRSNYNIFLTGKLISKKPLNLWSQFMYLDGGRSFGNHYFRFRSKYFYMLKLKYGPKWVLKKEYINLFNEIIYRSCIRYTRDDIALDFPEVRKELIKIKMAYDVEVVYEEVCENVISEIETEVGHTKVNTTHIFQKLLRLQQITSGFINTDDGYVELTHTPKLDRLIEDTETILDEDESIIIWCRFKFTMKMITKRLKEKKIEFITLSGDDSGKEKDIKWRKFQKSKTINVFVGQVKAGGIGLELFKKHNTKEQTQHTYNYERTWEFDDKDQAEGRSNRIGQLACCRFVDMYLEGTIDEKMFDIQRSDKNLADLILKHGVRNVLKRR